MDDIDEREKQPAEDETPDIFSNNLETERGNAGHSSAKLQEGWRDPPYLYARGSARPLPERCGG
jgi:hypothetical protein